MGKMQRTKGATFERDLCHAFAAFFGVEVKRNIGQARDGGNDIDVGCLVVEAKRRASFKVLRSWLAQVQKACEGRHWTQGDGEEVGVTPIVVMREDGEGIPLVLLSLPDFLDLAGGEIRKRSAFGAATGQ